MTSYDAAQRGNKLVSIIDSILFNSQTESIMVPKAMFRKFADDLTSYVQDTTVAVRSGNEFRHRVSTFFNEMAGSAGDR